MISLAVLLIAASEPADAADEIAQQRLVDRTVTEMRLTLKDAQSARFIDVFFRSGVGRDNRKRWTVCGKINSKNSYGAYTGFQTFLATETYLWMGGGKDEWFTQEACDPSKGTWYTDNDLSKRFTELVTAP